MPAAAAAPERSAEKDAKKAAKAAEKAAKEAAKEAKRAEREAAAQRKAEGPEIPSVTLLNMLDHPFGNLSINSQGVTQREWTLLGKLEPALQGQTVWVRARVHNSRKQSAKLGFLELRQRLATVQAVGQGKDLAGFLCALPRESVVDIQAE